MIGDIYFFEGGGRVRSFHGNRGSVVGAMFRDGFPRPGPRACPGPGAGECTHMHASDAT